MVLVSFLINPWTIGTDRLSGECGLVITCGKPIVISKQLVGIYFDFETIMACQAIRDLLRFGHRNVINDEFIRRAGNDVIVPIRFAKLVIELEVVKLTTQGLFIEI